MAKQLQLLLTLAIGLSPVIGDICSEYESLSNDTFKDYGCFCGTDTTANNYNILFATYTKAFMKCHEGDDVTIECAFKKDVPYLNRKPLTEIPVAPNGSTARSTFYKKVTCLLLSGNQISNITFDQMKQFTNLKYLYLDSNPVAHIGPGAFDNHSKLTLIDFSDSKLTEFPNITNATGLEELLLAHNKLKVIPNLSNLTSLKLIDLQHNQIQELVPEHFKGLKNVNEIKLNNNEIGVLKNYVFQDMHYLNRLQLDQNRIHLIEQKAFSGTKITDLELRHNKFSVLPTSDLQELKRLYVKGVRTLVNFPRAYKDDEENKPTFPMLEKLILEYQTHCCWYKDYVPENSKSVNFNNETNVPVGCSPQPDAFHPCYDIIDFLVLRIAIWLTIAAAVCGNILVIVVLIFSMITRGATVPQVLITNLAAADFCLAVYLIFIASADLDTAGNYQNEAFNWEFSVACKTAGFFAVFSSVASVCLLALITFERMTTIAFSYTGKRFMTMPITVVALIVVWSIAFTFGILPAVDVSEYGKVCICLPFEARTSLDKGYIISLLIFTGIICFFILICYVILFIRVKKTTSSLSGRQELRIAFKMSILVLTDFVIWAPIAVIGLTGVLRGESLIDVQESKYLMIFIFPINSWVNPILYSILQTAFRNQLCDIFAHCGFCKEYHQRRKARAQGITYNAPTSDERRFRISSITSTATLNSFLSFFNKRASVTSIGSNDVAQTANLTKRKHRSHSSTSSDQQSIKEGRFLAPIHESTTPEIQEYAARTEADTVFYTDTSHPANDSSTTQLLSTHNNNSIVLGEGSCDSGIAHSDQNNGIASNGLSPNLSNGQPLMFNVSFSPSNVEEESTEC